MEMSISVVKGHGSMSHNNRDFITPNVDLDRVKDNIIYKCEPLEQAYKNCFAQAIEEYNAKQKRADRRIDGINGYMSQIRNSKNGEKLYYETVIQIGNKFDCSVGSTKAELTKKVLNEFMQDFSERNPNLYVFNAVLHMDEATPHLHIDYIPVAHGYQKGLQVRNSLDKALKEQGIDGKATKRENSTHNWQEREKDSLERIMNKYGIERAEDTGINRKHMSIDQYKAVAEQIANEVRYVPEEIEKAPVLLNKERVSVKKADLEQLEQRARLSVVHENNTKLLEEKTEKNFDDSKIYISQKMSLALSYLEVAEKKLQEANAEKEKAAELQAKAQKMYKAQEELNVKFKQLYSLFRTQELKVKELTDENTSLKAQICDLTASFDDRLQKCTEPLRNHVESLTGQIKRILRAVRYISHAFTGEVGSAFLDATVKASTKALKKQGFDNIANDQEREVNRSITDEVALQLHFKKGKEGLGLYSPSGVFIVGCNNMRTANSMFPASNIANQNIDRGFTR